MSQDIDVTDVVGHHSDRSVALTPLLMIAGPPDRRLAPICGPEPKASGSALWLQRAVGILALLERATDTE
jgi:hypothetical protein